jgi:hypothetical protein
MPKWESNANASELNYEKKLTTYRAYDIGVARSVSSGWDRTNVTEDRHE